MVRKFTKVCQLEALETRFQTHNLLLPPLSGISLTIMLRMLRNISHLRLLSPLKQGFLQVYG